MLQTGTEDNWNKNIFLWMCVRSEDITVKCIVISTILNLSLRGQQLLPIPGASKIIILLKWLLRLKNHVSHWMDKIISEAVFTREKKMFCSIKASGWGACSTGEHEHMADWWMLAFRLPCILLPWLSAVSSFELILRVLKIRMLPVEIPDLKPLHAFGIPIVIQLTPNNSNPQ